VSYVSWAMKLAIFAALLGFAFMNSEMVTLRYWFSYEWRAPLVLVLVAFLIMGVVVGLLASLSTIFRLRRQVQSLKKELKLQASAAPAPPAPIASATPAPIPEHPVA
jgi:lipopolysaccharide assembly protein A